MVEFHLEFRYQPNLLTVKKNLDLFSIFDWLTHCEVFEHGFSVMSLLLMFSHNIDIYMALPQCELSCAAEEHISVSMSFHTVQNLKSFCSCEASCVCQVLLWCLVLYVGGL